MARPTTPPSDPNDLSTVTLAGAAGDFVFHEGDPAGDCFIVQDGRIELLKGPADQGWRIAVLGAGDVFGEGALFEDHPRDVSARAITDFQVLRVDRPTFDHLVGEDPSIATKLAGRLAAYLRVLRAMTGPSPGDSARRASGTSRPVPVATAAEPAPAVEDAAVPSENRRAVLTVPGTPASFPLGEKDEVVVGRPDRARKRLPDIDLSDYDTERSLSRRHATILHRSGRFFVREEPGVANGTFIDGQRLGSGTEVELTDGARVTFGLIEARFGYETE